MDTTFKCKVLFFAFLLLLSATLHSCKKIEEMKKDPEITPLQHGFKLSAAIGYCASLAAMAFEGKELPENVVFEAGAKGDLHSSGLLYVTADAEHPIPFNDQFGQVIIGGVASPDL